MRTLTTSRDFWTVLKSVRFVTRTETEEVTRSRVKFNTNLHGVIKLFLTHAQHQFLDVPFVDTGVCAEILSNPLFACHCARFKCMAGACQVRVSAYFVRPWTFIEGGGGISPHLALVQSLFFAPTSQPRTSKPRDSVFTSQVLEPPGTPPLYRNVFCTNVTPPSSLRSISAPKLTHSLME